MKEACRRPMTILLIEDNRSDAYYTCEVLKDSTVPNEVCVVQYAAEALARMHGNNHSQITIPDLILLDLNLPLIDGFAFLEKLRKEERLKKIKVFILSASAADVDIKEAHRYGVSAYLEKPLDLEDFEEKIRKHFQDGNTD